MKTIQYPLRNNIRSLQSDSAKTIVSRLLILLLACTVLTEANSQTSTRPLPTDKRLILADQYFAAGEYVTAASLYGQFLKPVVTKKTSSDFPLNRRNTQGKTGAYANKTDILLKQAESYRLAHYWNEAAESYIQCFEKDSAKYAEALYWYAVCKRSTGDYNAAEENINRFLNDYAKGNASQKDALKEKETIAFIKTQLARPDSVMYHVEKLNTSFETEKGVFAPVAIVGNQLMITSTHRDSVAIGINPYRNRLFNASYKQGSLEDIQPVNFQSIDSTLSQGAASISMDGNHLYLTQWKKENGQVISSIYISNKTNKGWSRPRLLASVNQAGHNSKQPFCTADGKYLFFSSDRTGGQGNFDIWYAPIQADGTTAVAINAGNSLNTAGNEQAPFYHTTSGTLVFASDRLPGMGGYDLFSSKGAESNWKTPENMGYPVNSSRDDVYFFSAEKGNLLEKAIVSSDRGSECCLATYAVTKTVKRKMLSGVLRDCKNNDPVADAEVILKDGAGRAIRTLTNEDGRYIFELTESDKGQLFISKEKYNEKIVDVNVEGISESNWQTDTLLNTEGCVEKKLVIRIENVVTVYFDFNRSKLNARQITQLDSIYKILQSDTAATIQISGYTDGLGTVEYNKTLSDERAQSCASYLIGKGIDPARISFESFGACCPVEMELLNGRDNPNARSKNRRALINISRSEE